MNANDSALKDDLGYGSVSVVTILLSRLGAKHYVSYYISVTLDVSIASIQNAFGNLKELGIKAGYTIFLAENVCNEPRLWYKIGLNEENFNTIVKHFKCVVQCTIKINLSSCKTHVYSLIFLGIM